MDRIVPSHADELQVCTNRSAVARRFNLVNSDVDLPYQDSQGDDGDFTAFEDEEGYPSSGMAGSDTQAGSQAQGTLALMRSSSARNSSSAAPPTLRSAGRSETNCTPSASLLALADAVHRSGAPRTMGSARPHVRSRLGISPPIVPVIAMADDADESTDQQDAGEDQGRKGTQLGHSFSRSLLGPTPNQGGLRGGLGVDLLSDLPASDEMPNLWSSPPSMLPARTQMRTAAHTDARQRALRAKSRSKANSPRKNAEAGPSRLPARASVSARGKRAYKGDRDESDAKSDSDTDSPPRKRATAPAPRLRALGKDRGGEIDRGSRSRDELGDSELSADGQSGPTGRRVPLSTMPLDRSVNVAARNARLVAATSSADTMEADKSSSPRPIPSVIQPHDTASAATAKNKGKARASVLNPLAASTAGAKLLQGKGKRKAVAPGVFTMDSIAGPGEGSYAIPALPADTDVAKWRRKKQIEAFEGVEAVQGQGPYGYYNCTLP